MPLLRVAFVALLVMLSSVSDVLAAKDKAPPNIVLVMCDDLGYGDLACYGSPSVKTPHIDRFASRGMRFTDFYSAAPNCSPSRTGLMTGRTPTRLGIHNWIPWDSPMHVTRKETTIATLLRGAGYDTCLVGKWHINGGFHRKDQPQPNDHGFNHWLATQNNAIPTHHNPDNFYRNGKAVGKIEGFAAQIVTDEAIQWLEKIRDPRKPFFMFVTYHEPHEPIASDHKYAKLYPAEGKPSRYDPTVTSLQAHHGNITQMDANFGRLLAALESNQLDSKTLVIFTSDNGPAMTAAHPHGFTTGLRQYKGYTYEGGIRVPGIAVWPGKIEAGSTNDTPVGGIDMLPTLAEIGQVPEVKTSPLDGTSITKAFEGKHIKRDKPLYWHFNAARTGPKVAIRMGNWKLLATVTGEAIKPYSDILEKNQQILKSAELDQFELYNLKKDPNETRDLSSKKTAKLEEMSALMRPMYSEVRKESVTWPAWQSPRWEGKRIREFVEGLKK